MKTNEAYYFATCANCDIYEDNVWSIVRNKLVMLEKTTHYHNIVGVQKTDVTHAWFVSVYNVEEAYNPSHADVIAEQYTRDNLCELQEFNDSASAFSYYFETQKRLML